MDKICLDLRGAVSYKKAARRSRQILSFCFFLFSYMIWILISFLFAFPLEAASGIQSFGIQASSPKGTASSLNLKLYNPVEVLEINPEKPLKPVLMI